MEALAAASALCVNSAFDTNAATTFQIFPTQLLCAMAYVKIEAIKNGPFIVMGEVDLIDAALSFGVGVLRIGALSRQPLASSDG